MPRLEIRLSELEAARLDVLRGSVAKGTWVKRQLGLVEEKVLSGGVPRPDRDTVRSQAVAAPSRPSIPALGDRARWMRERQERLNRGRS